ncbi:hypothetical protein DZ860_03350 [Vibrio sinensis]|uniref:Uncharacterized protein n=1 Tax=Vibrio sinensis TaxID=2302434 RepID=A0A3A6RF69_9VIBR|nr:hypothetical protein DZ860_03350 [Vibrio sinensis]
MKKFFRKEDKGVQSKSLRSIEPKNINDLFLWHLEDLGYFKQSCYSTVLRHLKHEIDLNKQGVKLTTEQKKELGINARLAITTDLVDVLSDKGITLSDPKSALKRVYYRATFEANRLESLQKIMDAGFFEVIYRSSGDERDCPWCEANNGNRFPVSEEANEAIKTNCTCAWNRGFFGPVVKVKK